MVRISHESIPVICHVVTQGLYTAKECIADWALGKNKYISEIVSSYPYERQVQVSVYNSLPQLDTKPSRPCIWHHIKDQDYGRQ